MAHLPPPKPIFKNIAAAKGLQTILGTNLGPDGTLKMLVSGGGDLRLTKDGSVLLKQMHIKHPTASLIARNSEAQDKITGDGTTTSIILVGELLNQCERYLADGLHPRILVDGFDQGKALAMEFLEKFAYRPKTIDRDLLLTVAQTCCRTKVDRKLADKLAEICVDAVLTVNTEGSTIDLHMVERMFMMHKDALATQFVRGLVLDHGPRNPGAPTRMENVYILTCNVSLEYEKTEVNSGFYYSSAEEREAMVAGERAHVEARCRKIIALKEAVCAKDPTKTFLVINQKGIDPGCLQLLSAAGIPGIRRAKRRNMERIAKACGGRAINHLDSLSEDILGYAGLMYVQQLGDDKYTFLEHVKNPTSCTVLIKGPNRHTIKLVQDCIHDGLRSVKNVIEDQCVVPGAGSFEIALHHWITQKLKTIKGRTRLGVRAFADAILVVPKTLASNSGFDPVDSVILLEDEYLESIPKGQDIGTPIGLDITADGCTIDPIEAGIFDNFAVKKLILSSCTMIASQILLIDDILNLTVINKPQKAKGGPGGGMPQMPQ